MREGQNTKLLPNIFVTAFNCGTHSQRSTHHTACRRRTNTSTFSFTSSDPIPITPNYIQLLQIVIRRRILILQRSGISFVSIFR
ncbi:hypothetical protein S245_006903 [Arachis hypogaea]